MVIIRYNNKIYEKEFKVMNIGDRIKILRNQNNLTQEELGVKIGVKKAAIQKYESGQVENIKRTTIEKLSNIFNVSPSYLMGFDDITTPVTNFASIPIIGTVKAGVNGIAEMDFQGYEQVANLKNADEYRCFKVKGDSMSPQILDGDIAVVHMQSTVENGELAVVIVDGEEGTLKKVQCHDGALSLVAFNQNYEPRIFFGEQMNEVFIWGKVVKIERNF